MRGIASALVCLALAAAGCAPSAVPPQASAALASGSGRPAPVVLLVSLDGWRWDYLEKADTPNLRALAARGVRAESLIPAFPSKTFPNHYSIVTGLYPEHHGITSNTMVDQEIGERFSMSAATARDRRWWGGEPLWVTAVRQGRRATSMFWPGSDVEIGGVRPNEWRVYDGGFPNESRVEQVLAWLSEPAGRRPSFITLYFSDVDSAGHDYGPSAPETFAAARRLDGLLGVLIEGIRARGLEEAVTLIVVSDHGMSQLSPDRRIFLDDYLDMLTVDMVDWSPVAQLWPRSGSPEVIYKALHGRHPALKVYRKQEMPAELHFSAHPRIAPVLALADEGWAITTRDRFAQLQAQGRVQAGDHGYSPAERSMHGLFIAAGPTLRRGLVVPPFENIHLYEFMCRILGLKPAKNDGDRRRTELFFSDRAAFLPQGTPWRHRDP
jgi:predicted AlkP superfamily pyrophosphatase or phosphodiesterase